MRLLILIFCTGLLFGTVSYAFAQNDKGIIPKPGIGSPFTLIDSPLKQFRESFDFTKIKCMEGLQLIFKSSNGHPACVKKSSIETLSFRKWGTTKTFPNVVKLDIIKPDLFTIDKNQTLEIPMMLPKSSISNMRIVSGNIISFQDPISNEIMMPVDAFKENETAVGVGIEQFTYDGKLMEKIHLSIISYDTTKDGTYTISVVLYNGNFNLVDSFMVKVK